MDAIEMQRWRPGASWGLWMSDDADSEAPRPTFDAVYRAHRARIFAVVRSVVGADPDIDDVVQRVLIELNRSLPSFEGRSKLTTWLHRLTVNVALQHLRKKRRGRWLSFFGSQGDADVPEPATYVHEAGRLESRELLRHVELAVGRLSEKKRVVWQLYELEGFDPKEIGEILGIPLNTARSRLLAARKELAADLEVRGLLDDRPPDPGDNP